MEQFKKNKDSQRILTLARSGNWLVETDTEVIKCLIQRQDSHHHHLATIHSAESVILQEPIEEGPNFLEQLGEQISQINFLTDIFNSLSLDIEHYKIYFYGLAIFVVLRLVGPVLYLLWRILNSFKVPCIWLEPFLNFHHGTHLSNKYTDDRVRTLEDTVRSYAMRKK